MNAPLPLVCVCEPRQEGMYNFALFNHKQVTIYLFKLGILTVATDGCEGLLIYCPTNLCCAAGLEQLKGLYYEVPLETQNPTETSEGLTYWYIYYKKP